MEFTAPLVTELRAPEGMSMVKLSRVGMVNRAVAAAVADRGESPVEDGDMILVWR